jgi:hypothetical protein
VNDVTDVVQNTRGAKLDKGEFDGQEDVMSALIGGSPTDIQNYVPAAKRLGIKSVPKKPYVKTATISPKAKIKNLGFTKNVLQEASKARKEGYDGIRYTSPEVVDSIEEIAIFNNKALESQATKAPVENQTMTVEPTDVMAQVRAKMNQDNVDGVEAAKRLGVTKEYEQAINSEMSKAYRENTEPLMPKTPQVSKTETQATTSLEQEAKKYKTAEEFVEAARSIENFDPAEAKTIFKDVKTGDGEAGVVKALTEFYNKANPTTEAPVEGTGFDPTKPKSATNRPVTVEDYVSSGVNPEQAKKIVKNKQVVKELETEWLGKKLNDGTNVDKIAIEDNRLNKSVDGVERVKSINGYKDIEFQNPRGENRTYRQPKVVTEIVDVEPQTTTPKANFGRDLNTGKMKFQAPVEGKTNTETNITDPKLADNKIDTDDLKTERPQAYKMIDELSRELRDIDSANGVELIEPSVDAAYSATDDTYRVSTNTPFYKQHYKDTGRKQR